MKKTGKPKDISNKYEGRLKAICTSATTVNALRADFSGNIKLAHAKEATVIQSRQHLLRHSVKHDREKVEHMAAAPEYPKSNDQHIELNVFGVLASDDAEFSHPSLIGRRGRIVTLCGTPESLDDAAQHDNLIHLNNAHTLKHPNTVTESAATLRPNNHKEHVPFERSGGANILVGFIDVGGCDFTHQDFLDAQGNSRFVAIWDQGDTTFASPKAQNKRFSVDYGSYITREHINYAMNQANNAGISATDFLPQSQCLPGSHATHVASIAAGSHSAVPQAKIAGVSIALPQEDLDRRLSFYDTTRIVHAVEFLYELGDQLIEAGEIDAVVVNISLGTNGGPHDNSSPMSRWLDLALAQPGRCICVAAGNSGQEAPQQLGDKGFIFGRVHSAGNIPASGLESLLEWIVVGDGVEDISENEMEIWYPPQDRIAVQLCTPDGDWLPVIRPTDVFRNEKLRDGTVVSIFNELYDAGNGFNRISIYLSPFFSDTQIVGVTPGQWTVKLIGEDIRDGHFHAWIERDDPAPDKRHDNGHCWRFPSYFSEKSAVDRSTISTLACGDRIIAVANYDEQRQDINISSSQGPTRDGRLKPDIAAPGTDIWAANGFDTSMPWVSKTGTSMAAPFVASITAAMLSLKPDLTAAQIMGILRCTATPIIGRNYEWQDDAGYGIVNYRRCIEEVRRLSQQRRVSLSTQETSS